MRNLLIIVVLAGILAACGTTSPTVSDSADAAGSAPSLGAADTAPPATPPVSTVESDGVLQVVQGEASGPSIGVAEALAHTGSDLIRVNGPLFIGPEGILLCEVIAESDPPQCGGARIEVRGLDFSILPELNTAGELRWAEQVELTGEMVAD